LIGLTEELKKAHSEKADLIKNIENISRQNEELKK
jgi:hypothetical protein